MRRLLVSVLLLVGLVSKTGAQDAAADAEAVPGPPAGSAAQATAEDGERDALEPAVPSQVLAADTRRRATDTGVMDEMDLDRTEITGNQELPKVLYIVPWQKSDPGNLMGKPVNTLLDEVLEPIDRSEFTRQVRYYKDLNED